MGSQTKSTNNQFETNRSIQIVAYVVDIINEYRTHSEKDKTHGRGSVPGIYGKYSEEEIQPKRDSSKCVFSIIITLTIDK